MAKEVSNARLNQRSGGELLSILMDFRAAQVTDELFEVFYKNQFASRLADLGEEYGVVGGGDAYTKVGRAGEGGNLSRAPFGE